MNSRDTAQRGVAPPAPQDVRATIGQAFAICRQPAHMRRTCLIGLVVGCLLTLINQLDVFIDGKATAVTAAKVALNFCVPFVVSNLGLLAGSTSVRA